MFYLLCKRFLSQAATAAVVVVVRGSHGEAVVAVVIQIVRHDLFSTTDLKRLKFWNYFLSGRILFELLLKRQFFEQNWIQSKTDMYLNWSNCFKMPSKTEELKWKLTSFRFFDLSLPRARTICLSLSLSNTYAHTHTHSLLLPKTSVTSLSLSLSHTHTHTLTLWSTSFIHS